MVRRGDEAVNGHASFRPVAAYEGSFRERNGVLRIVIGAGRSGLHDVQAMFTPKRTESDRSDGQPHTVHQQ